MAESNTFLCIDLKSFYASVECMERDLDPMTTNLVVADASRTEKTICLAVSPSLKAFGIPGRPRLFEVVQKVKAANAARLRLLPGHTFAGETYDADALKTSPALAISYITAPPRMALYMKYSTRIYETYLKYIAPEDIHVYSIDEVFMDVTRYLATYRLTALELARKLIHEVYTQTGITATAGIGTNLYLAKVAMDVTAKKASPDEYGARIAALDEMSYRRQLWEHRPLTDFWRVGRGYAKKLEANGLYTMGDVARYSVQNDERLYELFGVNAELLIDHAWGWEPCTMAEIKAYKPSTNSVTSGQVLSRPYPYEKTRLIVREMTELLALDLVEKGLVTDQLTLTVGYDIENLTDPTIAHEYNGEVTTDHYGRKIPKNAHGTANLNRQTASTRLIMEAVMELFDRIIDPKLLSRRIHLTANRLVSAESAAKAPETEQLDLFTDYGELEKKRAAEEAALERERRMQQTVVALRKKYGKNAVLKGVNLEEGATTIERNKQIGGHKA